MKILIVGGGKVGASLAEMLLEKNHEVNIIESRLEQVKRIKKDLPEEMIILGSGTDPNVLEAAGIKKADVVAAVTGKDEINLVVTNLTRVEYGVPRIVARVNNPKNAWLFTPEMGVDVTIDQAEITAELITEGMSIGDMHTFKKLRQEGNFSLVELQVGEDVQVARKTIKELSLPPQCVLVAILRSEGLQTPTESTQILAGDEIIALVATEIVDTFRAMFT